MYRCVFFIFSSVDNFFTRHLLFRLSSVSPSLKAFWHFWIQSVGYSQSPSGLLVLFFLIFGRHYLLITWKLIFSSITSMGAFFYSQLILVDSILATSIGQISFCKNPNYENHSEFNKTVCYIPSSTRFNRNWSVNVRNSVVDETYDLRVNLNFRCYSNFYRNISRLEVE